MRLLSTSSSPADPAVALVAEEGAAVVPERSEGAESAVVAVVVSDPGRSWP